MSLTLFTECKLCGQKFNHYQIADLIESNPGQAMAIYNKFAEHIQKKHPQEDMRAQIAAQSFLGLMRMFHYQSQDDSALQLRDYQRWQIFSMVQKCHVSDEKIAQQVAELALPAEHAAKVELCMRLMRDILEERPPFRPADPREAKTAGNGKLVV